MSPFVATQARAARVPLVRLGAGVRGVQVLVEPDDGAGALTGAIRDAGRSIWLTMYMLTNRTIIHDLEYAHAAGVDVRVILEPHPYGASDNTNQSAYDILMAADIPVHWSSPRYRLTHEKSMVVDGDTAYVMTTNFTRASFQANREFDVVDRRPVDVATVRALFIADWTNRVYTTRDGNLPLSPSDARPLLQALIGSARRTLDVYGEELQDPGMEKALASAARHGVHVRLILPAPSGPDYDARGVRLVTAASVRVRRLPRSYLYIHAKVIVADGRRAFVGSQNLSAASLDDNRELGIIVADQRIIGTLEDTFNGDWSYRGG
ncbi:MAG: phospholipase D-like domain-containing protein [Chloroflexi bacterium]|nr:phospholipase D-like domain-containing protein [Chloroflexota bacterium]